MTEYGCTNLPTQTSFVGTVVDQGLGVAARALRDDRQRVALSLFVGFPESRRDRFRGCLPLGYDDRLSTTRDPGDQREVATVPAHHFDHQAPAVGGRRHLEPVDGLEGDIERGVHSKGDVGT